MLKKLYNFFKRIIVSFFILYGYNRLVPTLARIPINIVTVSLITIFNIPSLIILIIIKMIFY
ncbi:MAG: pro-sigmaK processing inhibitor BofA family protein [Bacilli bacterium]|nr:pro-sigmaK processing inhibitor BofA family protein [Bacilli bacterium]